MDNKTLVRKSHEESKKYHNHTTITRRPNSATGSRETTFVTPKDARTTTLNKLTTRVFIKNSLRKSTFTKVSGKIMCRK